MYLSHRGRPGGSSGSTSLTGRSASPSPIGSLGNGGAPHGRRSREPRSTGTVWLSSSMSWHTSHLLVFLATTLPSHGSWIDSSNCGGTMRTVQQISNKMDYFKVMHMYTVTFIRRERDQQKLLKLKVKRACVSARAGQPYGAEPLCPLGGMSHRQAVPDDGQSSQQTLGGATWSK